MLNTKNLSPQQLSATTSLIISLIISVGIYFFEPIWWIALISFFVIFLGSYGLILFMVQSFVYRKIKLNGKWMDYTDVLKDKTLQRLLCDEEICDFFRYNY